MVREVVGTEGGGVGDADGEIGEDGEEAVVKRGPEREIMGDLVDGKEQILIRACSKDVCGEEEARGKDGGMA